MQSCTPQKSHYVRATSASDIFSLEVLAAVAVLALIAFCVFCSSPDKLCSPSTQRERLICIEPTQSRLLERSTLSGRTGKPIYPGSRVLTQVERVVSRIATRNRNSAQTDR